MNDDRSPAPEGFEFLKLVKNLEDKCEAETDAALPKMGKRALACVERLGTILSLLDRLSSCWWGCKKGDHAIERLVFRAVSLGRSSVRLFKFGFYDESLALTRSIGEVANLMCLFTLDKVDLERWRAADPQAKKNLFGPVKVRLRIESHGARVPVDEHRYRALSDVALHVAGPISPQAHNLLELPVSGGHFQQEGFLVSLNELALATVYVALFGSTLIPIEKDVRRAILYAGRNLAEEIGGADILHIDEYRAQMREHLATALEQETDTGNKLSTDHRQDEST